MTEHAKMLAGALYQAADPDLVQARRRASALLQMLNTATDEPPERRREILETLLGSLGVGVWIEPPFFCDYGTQIHLGDRVYFNTNAVVLDPAPVRIGNDVLFGPSVQLYTATHPLDYQDRRAGWEAAHPINIGSDVWVGGGAIICPGVRIGSRSVIGAGSVVTRDIPEGVLAVGNPCRVLRTLS